MRKLSKPNHLPKPTVQKHCKRAHALRPASIVLTVLFCRWKAVLPTACGARTQNDRRMDRAHPSNCAQMHWRISFFFLPSVQMWFDLTYLWAHFMLWGCECWSCFSTPLHWWQQGEALVPVHQCNLYQASQMAALTSRAELVCAGSAKEHRTYCWQPWDSGQVMALSHGWTEQKFWKCKKKFSSQRFVSNPQNTLVPNFQGKK